MLAVAGDSKDKTVLAVNLSTIAEQEASAWYDEAADSALGAMNRVHAEHEELEDDRKASRSGLLRGDAGLELVATLFRNVLRVCCCKKRSAARPSGVQPGSPDLKLPFFSRKAWHVVVMFIMTLNGFFVSLLVQGAVYSFDEIYDKVGIFPVVLIPLPLVVNGLLLQKAIFRDYVLICSILRIDASTLGEVVGHFSEIVELRSSFATSLLLSLKERGHSIAELEKKLHAHDMSKTGFVEIDRLRTTLASLGFHLTRFRFNSVVKLLFELQGTKVEYAQLIQLLALMQHGDCVEPPPFHRTMTSFEDMEGTRSNRAGVYVPSRHLPLLAQSSLAPEPGPSDFMYVGARTPTAAGRPALERGLSRQFVRSNSRLLHDVFNLRSASLSSPKATSSSNYSVQ